MMKMLVYAIAVFALPIGTAHAASTPPLREGLWQSHTQEISSPGNKKTDSISEICRNHAIDEHAESLAKNMKGCTPISENIEGDTLTAEMRCAVGKTVIDSKSVVTFQGDTAAHSESHTTYTPGLAGMTGDVMIKDMKYVGSCPAGMKPGDVRYPK
ncbi:DUF3617 family protein [Rhodanobacter sp. C03]|uniref:DUF3617 domain-containing protein n=1 Tax=Rhodanobacter sp. C03 TaxID=1945858 RepID=UPI000985A9AE|nr:DUF3617 family protein [Rhodanobacter sp. C03]OOG60229.1 hypothetical protein B0E48_05630 [Rhodanobacter sp. C03]